MEAVFLPVASNSEEAAATNGEADILVLQGRSGVAASAG